MHKTEMAFTVFLYTLGNEFYERFISVETPQSKFDQYLQCFGNGMKNTILNKGLVALMGDLTV